MSLLQAQPRQYEFAFPRLDTLVLVEENDSGVLIRMTRDSFSDEHKDAFLHELVEEGFISSRYQWLSNEDGSRAGVSWRIDRSWLRISEAVRRRARRVMLKLFVSTAGLWVAMMAIMIMVGVR